VRRRRHRHLTRRPAAPGNLSASHKHLMYSALSDPAAPARTSSDAQLAEPITADCEIRTREVTRAGSAVRAPAVDNVNDAPFRVES